MQINAALCIPSASRCVIGKSEMKMGLSSSGVGAPRYPWRGNLFRTYQSRSSFPSLIPFSSLLRMIPESQPAGLGLEYSDESHHK